MVYRALTLSAFVSLAAAAPGSKGGSIVKSIFQNDGSILDKTRRRMQMLDDSSLPSFLHGESIGSGRMLEDQQEECDSAFMSCLPNMNCVDCFATLELEGIDWTGVTPHTECPEVVQFLMDAGHCEKLEVGTESGDVFCKTFNACVIWENLDDDASWSQDIIDDDDWVNCTAITECKWEGMKKSWVGDGVCHDNMHGCYNTAVCDFDGGDCCKDSCVDGDSEYKQCGHDGYACRDPKSGDCDSSLTAKCPGSKDDEKPDPVTCKDDETKYKLKMYDSFGDGWDATTLAIYPKDNKKAIFTGGLKDGSEGTELVCLSKDPSCYNVETKGGTWGVEVSWEIKPTKDGAPSIAGGGAPDNCDFPVAGAECEKTCDGKTDANTTDDPDYKSFKELYNCISEKCIIQLGACDDDPICEKCFADDAPEYCYGVDTFVAVVECTVCSCTDKMDGDYCTKKPAGGGNVPKDKDNDNAKPQACTPKEIMAGTKSVMAYSECANVDEIGAMITDFDQNNFGQLDAFETCAHSFTDEDNHGGHTALGCMQILYNAMTNPTVKDNSDAPKEAISALAKDLYQNAEVFCGCSKDASEQCPLCPSFKSFKTLLFESLDACQALDEIDCDAWSEFWKPCKENLESEFSKSDFKSKEQCEYAKEKSCGNAGPFPAFRRLDCDKEIDKDAWDFYKSYSKNCLKGDDGIPPDSTPVKQPTKDPVVAPTKAPADKNKPTPADGNKPTAKPYIPSDGPAKPYAPSSDSKPAKKKKSRWFLKFLFLCALGGGGYYVYKQRSGAFNFGQYRRVRNFGNNFGYDMGGDSSTMYTNLNSSTTFEPPTLPPTPMMMGTEMT